MKTTSNTNANNVNNATATVSATVSADLTTKATAEVENAIDNALLNLAKKAKRAEVKAGNVKAGVMNIAIREERKNLKSTLQAVQNIANAESAVIPEVIQTTDTKEFLINSYLREEAIKANAKITSAQRILKGLNIGLKDTVTCKVAKDALKKLFDLAPVVVTAEGKREIAQLKKLQFSNAGVYKTEYYYVAPMNWEDVLTVIFVTNGGKAPDRRIEVQELTTLPNADRKGAGPIFSEVNGKMLQAKEETARAVFERYENCKVISKRLTESHATAKASEFIKETAEYQKRKV